MLGEREKQIPFGNDRQERKNNSKGKSKSKSKSKSKNKAGPSLCSG